MDIFKSKGFSFHEKVDNFIKVSHVSEKKSPKGFRWYPENPFLIHHWNVTRNVNIWEEVVNTKEYKEFDTRMKLKEIDQIIPKVEYQYNTRYLDGCPDKVKEFLESDTLLKVQSPMGSAKSEVIAEVIRQSEEKGLRILFISNRISLADDISKKYNGIKHYQGSELENNIYTEGDSLVVQLDSLHKFSTKYFDLVIFDEFSTCIQKMFSIERHQKKIITQIFSLKKKKIIALDAIIFDDILKLFKPKSKWIEINNKYRDDVELSFYSQKDKFIADLIQDAKNQPCTFSSGSINIMKVTEQILKEQNISCISITSETTKEQKKLIYESFNSTEPRWQVIMYSPTLTVGISNINDTKIHYHYDAGTSMDVLSSLQMTKRTRSAEKIKMYLKQRIKYNPTDLVKIQNELTDYLTQDEDGDTIGVSEVGRKLSVIYKVFNTLENLHKDSFKRLLLFQFNISNNIVKVKEKIVPFVYKMIKIQKQKQQSENLKLFDCYTKMNPEQISEIISKVYSTPEDEMIKIFEFYKDDKELNLSEDQIHLLIKEEIKTPGIIEAYKKIKETGFEAKDIYPKGYKYPLVLKEFKYIKKRNRWYLNPVLKRILNDKND